MAQKVALVVTVPATICLFAQFKDATPETTSAIQMGAWVVLGGACAFLGLSCLWNLCRSKNNDTSLASRRVERYQAVPDNSI